MIINDRKLTNLKDFNVILKEYNRDFYLMHKQVIISQ